MAGEAIFISYRRDDTADVAGRLFDSMARRFGKQRIFKDVDNLGPGVDFGDYIKSLLPRCRVVLALIGPGWLESRDRSNKRRLDDDGDWVRIEIETALATPDVLVVPVLVNGAAMPRIEDIPASLQPLLRLNAALIRRDPDFHDDAERLAKAIRASVNTGVLDLSKIAAPAQTKNNRFKYWLLATATLVIITTSVGALFWIQQEGKSAVLGAMPQSGDSDSRKTVPVERLGAVFSASGTTWHGRACWDLAGKDCHDIVWVFGDSGRFTATNALDRSDTSAGTWLQNGADFKLTYDNGTVYSGKIDGAIFTGTMLTNYSARGWFQMTLQPSS